MSGVKGGAVRRHASSQSRVQDARDDRRTPRALWEPLAYRFTLDAAASADNALVPAYYSLEDDSLIRSWRGHRVWCNPPFSKLEAWVAKAWAEMRGPVRIRLGEPEPQDSRTLERAAMHREQCAELVVMLLPASRTEQPFWQEYVEPFRDGPVTDGIELRTRFLRGRTDFDMPTSALASTASGSPFGCVLLTWRHV